MNRLTDANNIFDAGDKAMASSKFKYQTQFYRINQLLETAHIQEELISKNYHPKDGIKFPISERGKKRYITSNAMTDKVVNHVVCDKIITPGINPYIIHDNGASQKGKGVSFTRIGIETDLHQYYNKYGTNQGWILLFDFSGYYANIHHDKAIEIIRKMTENTFVSEDEMEITYSLVDEIMKSFEMDVSYLSDSEVDFLYETKVDPQMNVGIEKKLLSGKKMLRKGVDIGNQLSQDIGIIFPYRIDNYVKNVRGCKFYSRSTDDGYIIHSDKEFLKDMMIGIRKIANEYGIIINEKKTRIVKLASSFRFLQTSYVLTDTGRVIKKINPKSVTRERKKLKAYKRLYDKGELDYATIENSFKSWMGGNWRVMSRKQIRHLSDLYYELFGKKAKWKKNRRLNWLMEHA